MSHMLKSTQNKCGLGSWSSDDEKNSHSKENLNKKDKKKRSKKSRSRSSSKTRHYKKQQK